MSVMILDAGNSIIKAKIARREFGELAFPHALQPLTENEYATILARAGKTTPLLDYLRVNGKPYVIGESAERHGLVTQRNGAALTPAIITAFWLQLLWVVYMNAARKSASLAVTRQVM